MATVARRWSLAAAILGDPPSQRAKTGWNRSPTCAAWPPAFGLFRPRRRDGAGPAPGAAGRAGNRRAAAQSGQRTPGARPRRRPDPVPRLRPGLSGPPRLAALASFALSHPGRRLGAHLHLYDPTPPSAALARRAAEALGLDLVLTAETTPAETDPARRGTYYACARFCRLAEAAATHAAPILALDADALVRRDLIPLLARIPHVGLACSPLTVPWNRHPAGFLLLAPSAEAGRFLADAALLIGDSLGRGRRLWFLDQWALLLAAARHPRALRRLPWRCVYDTDFRETSWIWQANDDRKSRSPAYLDAVARLRAPP
jgi:hypothetical protein